MKSPPSTKGGLGGFKNQSSGRIFAIPYKFCFFPNFAPEGFSNAISNQIYEPHYPPPCSTLAFFLRDHLQLGGPPAAPGGTRHPATAMRRHNCGTQRHDCGRQRRIQGIRRNISGTVRLKSEPGPATIWPTGTLQGCKWPSKLENPRPLIRNLLKWLVKC